MNFETIKDRNGYEYNFQRYGMENIEPDFFPKVHRTFTVAFLSSNKTLTAIGITNSLYDFVSCIQYNSEELSKKNIKYFAFHYQSAAGKPHFISEEDLKNFDADFLIYCDPERRLINLNPQN